jgi:hypothetical protein
MQELMNIGFGSPLLISVLPFSTQSALATSYPSINSYATPPGEAFAFSFIESSSINITATGLGIEKASLLGILEQDMINSI